jgi:hypothetical protein
VAEVVWHFCTSCGGRLSPFTKFEEGIDAPEVGAKGRAVLLYSYNASHPDSRRAWCLGEKKWVSLSRVTEAEVWTMYVNRRGVNFRKDCMPEEALKARRRARNKKR